MKIFTCLLLLFYSATSFSAGQWCTGKVSRVYIDVAGSVSIHNSWRTDYNQICNINAVWKGVPLEVCKSWLSIVMSAQVSKSNVIVYYGDAPACNALPTYSNSPSPGYVMIKE